MQPPSLLKKTKQEIETYDNPRWGWDLIYSIQKLRTEDQAMKKAMQAMKQEVQVEQQAMKKAMQALKKERQAEQQAIKKLRVMIRRMEDS